MLHLIQQVLTGSKPLVSQSAED